MNTTRYIAATWYASIAAITISALLALSFFLVEPQVSQAIDSNPFTIKTTITDEISFLVQPANVTATGSINGITGGTANGSTSAVVRTNSATGYEMSIRFANNGSQDAMQGDTTGSDAIKDYQVGTSTEPTFLFSTASSAAVFGYTVSAADPSDLDASFLNNGSACNVGSTYTADRCWMTPTTTPFQIIDRTSDAPSGATTTLHFRIHVPSSPSPSLVADVYTATATLTALNQ